MAKAEHRRGDSDWSRRIVDNIVIGNRYVREGGENAMGRYTGIDDPFEEHEREMWEPVEMTRSSFVMPSTVERELSKESALQSIRETRARLLADNPSKLYGL